MDVSDTDVDVCGRVDGKFFFKKCKKLGMNTDRQFVQQCAHLTSQKQWKNTQCQEYSVVIHCHYFSKWLSVIDESKDYRS